MENKPASENFGFLQSTTAKMIMVAMLVLVLLIPLEYVKNLIDERSERKKEVVNEITELWGEDVHFYGPVLRIPYKSYLETASVNTTTNTTEIKRTTLIQYAYFFPEQLKNTSKIDKNTALKRGLYNNAVFTAKMQFSGHFIQPDFEKLQIKTEDVIWEKASIVVKTTNLKSIKSDLDLQLNNQVFVFESKAQTDKFYGELETNLFDYRSLENEQKLQFSFDMTYNGSNSVKFIPIGKTTTINMDSDWESPSFEGPFAANTDSKTISNKGFHADWKVLHINRPFSQQHLETLPNLNEFLFGVKLIETVDQYQQNERAAKYGFLVIALTFLVFFLIQSVSKIVIHIFQYSMIGVALIMFYTLLISITEHSSFALAYLIASVAVIVMIVWYSFSILKNKKFPLFIGLALTSLYTFLFVIIQLENYALLVGSIGLFLILGAVMYCSRKIDWKNN